MWPGQQPPGGEQNPQDQNPYQQPGYQQPNPYQQQGYQQPGYQQPNPYQGYPTQPQWQGPGGPQPPKGGGNNEKKTTVTIAIVAAVAVVAAAVVTGVFVLKDDKKAVAKGDPKPTRSQPATAEPSEPASSGSTGGGPGGDPDAPDQPVIKGWQTVVNSKRHVAFDVPTKDWKTTSADTYTGFQDEKDKSGFPKTLISMTAPAYYKEEWCTIKQKGGGESTTSLAGTGVKGAQGAKSQAEAAQNEALNWVWAGYDQKKTGTFKGTKAKPFKSDHGITGKLSTATVTGVKKDDKCDSDGKAYAVTYTDTTGEYATWVLYAAKDVKGELDEATIKKIMSSLRPLD
ncbi:hypothetical protein C3486_12855 [Streptomyces sp. Ru73]|uniref:hypothetical protein n=1 Tax=Streptomyces sp. Ru73 TaxID=2080748 RepID=UPI000CDCE0C5|nr:hypothetical protein [Streptomyces sp. Ru73]POX40684.1 hypothetical protein C3486_12855 [Streptomyces sp. Ru73]